MNKKIIGLFVLIFLIVIMVTIKLVDNAEVMDKLGTEDSLKTITVATGGGKEDFIADERVVEIMRSKYKLDVVYDSWSNGKMIINPLVRENGDQYDVMFCSDQRFYDYYKLAPDKSNGEAERYSVLTGGLTLNTPIVIYSWDTVVDALEKVGIVTKKDSVYYITDMNRLLELILNGTKWTEIGLDQYGTVNIRSTDPVTSSPGATYYGLLLSILCGGQVTETSMQENLPKLKEFYEKSGYMNNTPADLFDSYLKMGAGSYPMIVDYEKSIVEFANTNPDGFDQIKDKIRVLYPTPTMWNSHCIATFSEEGNEYYKVFDDAEIQQIAWEKYGFRTGIIAGNYDVSKVKLSGIPQTITSTVTNLKMSMYNDLIAYLSK